MGTVTGAAGAVAAGSGSTSALRGAAGLEACSDAGGGIGGGGGARATAGWALGDAVHDGDAPAGTLVFVDH